MTSKEQNRKVNKLTEEIKNHEAEIAEIKSKLTISKVIKYYGLKADKQNRLKCPFHDDNNPSLCVNVESGWFKCMSSNCEATGSNIVGFVGHLLGYEYAESRDYLEQHYG